MSWKSLRSPTGRPRPAASLIVVSFALLLTSAARADRSSELADMSLEELMNVEVTSVSKKAQSKTSTAAAITVITQEDIRRGGFTVIPEALRTVPGLEVARVDASRWAISARGNNSLFANKLLVLIDGRSVYTPTFGGTYWDAQDYPIEDVERIEVIRGPGGTVWGANAVNGVINIITKNAKDTQGALVSGYAGNYEAGVTGRYGGAVGEKTHYRAFARGFGFADFPVDQTHDGADGWKQGHFGFRVDSEPTEKDTLRISGDYYLEDNGQGAFNPAAPPTFNSVAYKQYGGNVLLNWAHALSDDATVQAKAYYAGEKREFLVESNRHTGDVELQTDFSPCESFFVTAGANYRFSTNHIGGRSAGLPLSFDPNDEDFHIADVFMQGQYDLFDGKLSLIAGTKLGYNNWTDFEFQPSGRFVVQPVEGHAIWGAVSRAVRTPSEADRAIQIVLPGTPFPTALSGNLEQRSEDLLAFELGYRFFALEKVNAEVSLFWNEYEDLSSFVGVAPPPPPVVNLEFRNEAEQTVRGVEVEVNVLPTNWWRVKMAYTYMRTDQDLPTGAVAFSNPDDSNPHHQFNVQTFFDLPMGFELDASLYYVDGLPDVVPTAEPDNVEQYVRLDMRLGYRPTDWLELALVGQNLTDRRHYENNDFTLGQSTQVPRSGYAKVTIEY
jgi:iron complex outermembrane receptor protein